MRNIRTRIGLPLGRDALCEKIAKGIATAPFPLANHLLRLVQKMAQSIPLIESASFNLGINLRLGQTVGLTLEKLNHRPGYALLFFVRHRLAQANEAFVLVIAQAGLFEIFAVPL